MSWAAVLTGDIVNSTRLGTTAEAKLLQALHRILDPYVFDFYRGDSFQAFLADPTAALSVALQCRTAAIALDPEATPLSDVRISIGLGKASTPVKSLATAKGEAFVLSGRGLDSLQKSAGRLVIAAEHNPMANLALELAASYANSLYSQLTAKQAEVIAELLKGYNQQQVADKLNKSKSTISQHVTAARWDEIEAIIKNYTSITELLKR